MINTQVRVALPELFAQLQSIINELSNNSLTQSERANKEAAFLEAKNLLTEQYGEQLTETLQDVYDEYCPDDVPMHPADYIFAETSPEAGIDVHIDEYEGKSAFLKMHLSPLSLKLTVEGEGVFTLWTY